MITEEVFGAILNQFGQLLTWAQSTPAISAWGFEMTFFEVWTSNALAFFITDLFLKILDFFDPSDKEDAS